MVNDNTPADHPNMKELVELSNMVEKYEVENCSMGTPSLRDDIELKMFETKLKQKELAEILGTSSSGISEYLNGKRDITIEIVRPLHKKLHIDSDIILEG